VVGQQLKHFIDLLFCSFNFHDMAKPAETFKDLIVWQKAHRFVLATYSLTATFPRSDLLPDEPNAPGGNFGSGEHRRRIQKAEMESLLEQVSKLLVADARAIESNRRATQKLCNS